MDLRKKKTIATLVFPIKDSKVLLAKKTKKIGIGLWNGWGGAQEEGETIRQTAHREFQEESSCSASLEDFEYVGKITFHNQKSDDKKFDVEVHVFLLKKWQSEAKSSSEMVEPTLFPIDALPFSNMMASDIDWLPVVFSGEWFEAEVWYALDQNHLIQPTKIQKVERLGNVD